MSPSLEARPALLFDLDGTLIDSAPDIAAALNRLLVEAGRRRLALDAVTAMIGDGMAKLVERGFTATGSALPPVARPAAFARIVELYGAAACVHTRPYPEVAATLVALRAAGWHLAVCSNKPEALSRAILEDLGLAPHFEAIVGGDSLAVRKPDGGHLLGTLARMAGPPTSAIMIGDGKNDLLAARAAGLPAVLVGFGYGGAAARALGAEAVIDSFAELPAVFAGLARP